MLLLNVRRHRFMCFFFNDTATTEIYTLSLHDALPICRCTARCAGTHLLGRPAQRCAAGFGRCAAGRPVREAAVRRSEEHTSELQSRQYLVCRLLLEKKKKHVNYDQILSS